MTLACPECGERLVAETTRGLLALFRSHTLEEHNWSGHKADSEFWPRVRPDLPWFRGRPDPGP